MQEILSLNLHRDSVQVPQISNLSPPLRYFIISMSRQIYLLSIWIAGECSLASIFLDAVRKGRLVDVRTLAKHYLLEMCAIDLLCIGDAL